MRSSKARTFDRLRCLVLVASLLLLCVIFSCTKEDAAPNKPMSPSPTPAPLTAVDIEKAVGDPPGSGYRIWAIRVGETVRAKKRLFYSKAKKEERIPIVFFFHVLQGGGKTILVDAGFIDESKIQQWRVKKFRSPDQGLAAIGIAPHQVTDIILTHRHWDHIGGISLFVQAHLWMVEAEYKNAFTHYQKKDPTIARALQTIKDSGNLTFTKPVQQVFPGVTVVRQGKHTRHFQYVVVQNTDGRWILASDEGPLFINYQGPTPSGLTRNPNDSIAALTTMLDLVKGRAERIIPGHDPEVFRRFSLVTEGIVEISRGRQGGPAPAEQTSSPVILH